MSDQQARREEGLAKLLKPHMLQLTAATHGLGLLVTDYLHKSNTLSSLVSDGLSK